ncbi:hypothetical protein [Paenibacillus thalictri]|uniref:hypothetical protein n=1 Tax=Paenibacillus thalictri TaxID=2527873 RepID=UPI0013EF364A|nr:hypothetical protein [Paenibacillus thalictri]
MKRIANIQSIHFSGEETVQFQIQLIKAMQERLSAVTPFEGYKEYEKGPWANTRRIFVQGHRVYYSYDFKDDSIVVKGIKAPGMK